MIEAERIAVGTGSVKRGAGPRAIRAWRQQADLASATSTSGRALLTATPATLAAMGIGVSRRPRRAARAEDV